MEDIKVKPLDGLEEEQVLINSKLLSSRMKYELKFLFRNKWLIKF